MGRGGHEHVAASDHGVAASDHGVAASDHGAPTFDPRDAAPHAHAHASGGGTSARPPGGPGTTSPTPRTPATGGRTTTPAPTRPARPEGRPPATPSTGTSGGFGAIFDRLPGLITQGFDIAGRGAQFAQQFTQPPPPSGGPAMPGTPGPADAPFPIAPGTEPAFGGYPPPAPPAGPSPDAPQAAPPYGAAPAPPPAGAPPQGFDQLATLLQALYQRQVPPLPGPSYAAPAYAAPAYPTYAPPAPQNDPMAMLRVIVGNPQFQQALQWSSMLGQAAPRNIQLPIPAPGYPGDMRSVAIPMGAVMGTVASLAANSRNQINATTREDEEEVPEYLVSEDGDFVVDPASSDDRAALVAHLFLLSDEGHRSGWFQPSGETEAAVEFDKESEDESDQWAIEAGFTR